MAAGWNKVQSKFTSIPGIDPAVDHAVNPSVDPALDWALGVGRIYFFLKTRQQKWMPILVQLKGISASEFADGKRFLEGEGDAATWKRSVRVRGLYTQSASTAEIDWFCTALVTQEFFEFLQRNGNVCKFIARITLGLPLDQDSLPPSANGASA